jgi:hypothetical protein
VLGRLNSAVSLGLWFGSFLFSFFALWNSSDLRGIYSFRLRSDAAHWLSRCGASTLLRVGSKNNIFRNIRTPPEDAAYPVLVCGACILDRNWWYLDSDTPYVISKLRRIWSRMTDSSSLTKVSYAAHDIIRCGAFFKVRQWPFSSLFQSLSFCSILCPKSPSFTKCLFLPENY